MEVHRRGWFTVLVLLLAFLNYSSTKTLNLPAPGSPVVLVPGDGGSQFEARLDKPQVVHRWCSQFAKQWFSLWLNLEELAPYVLDCTVDNMRLEYDFKTRTTHNAPGVEIRQPGFGNTSSVEWLDPSQLSVTSYFNPIVNGLVKAGYTRNTNIRGAPYDFRKAPNEMKEFLADLKKLIEETYTANDNKKVVLVGHSMGNVFTLYLLNHQSQAWKDKYIKSFVSLAGPFAGAVKTVRLMASGDNLGVFVVNPLSARPQQRTMPSTAWLLPSNKFWKDDEVLVSGPLGNYTVKDYKKFFTDIDFPVGYAMHEDTRDLIYDLTPPGVEVHCLHGIKVKTPAAMQYTKSMWYNEQPNIIWGPGDGTVNLRSLHACLGWKGKQKSQIFHREFTGVNHMSILANKDVINYIKTVVNS